MTNLLMVSKLKSNAYSLRNCEICTFERIQIVVVFFSPYIFASFCSRTIWKTAFGSSQKDESIDGFKNSIKMGPLQPKQSRNMFEWSKLWRKAACVHCTVRHSNPVWVRVSKNFSNISWAQVQISGKNIWCLQGIKNSAAAKTEFCKLKNSFVRVMEAP